MLMAFQFLAVSSGTPPATGPGGICMPLCHFFSVSAATHHSHSFWSASATWLYAGGSSSLVRQCVMKGLGVGRTMAEDDDATLSLGAGDGERDAQQHFQLQLQPGQSGFHPQCDMGCRRDLNDSALRFGDFVRLHHKNEADTTLGSGSVCMPCLITKRVWSHCVGPSEYFLTSSNSCLDDISITWA